MTLPIFLLIVAVIIILIIIFRKKKSLQIPINGGTGGAGTINDGTNDPDLDEKDIDGGFDGEVSYRLSNSISEESEYLAPESTPEPSVVKAISEIKIADKKTTKKTTAKKTAKKKTTKK